MAARLRSLIAETDAWQAEHQRRGRFIEAAACAIRIRALRDALAVVEGGRDG